MSKYIETSKLGSAIDAWAKRGSQWIKEGQTLGLSALHALDMHGDVGYVTRLYKAMPKGSKSAAMAEWILAFGAVTANTGKDKAEKPFLFAKDKTCDLVAAEEKPWYDFQPEKAPDEIFDVQKAVLGLFKKASKAKQVAHRELLETMKTALEAAGVDLGEAGTVELVDGTLTEDGDDDGETS